MHWARCIGRDALGAPAADCLKLFEARVARALVDVYRGEMTLTHPLAFRVARIVTVAMGVGTGDCADFRSVEPLVVAQKEHFVDATPLRGRRLRVDGGACHGVEVVCAAHANGTELRVGDATTRVILSRQPFLVFIAADYS